MCEEEILWLWKKGISKHKLAEMYKRRYNQRIKIVRLELRNRHARKNDRKL